MHGEIARDHARLNEDMRRGRWDAVRRDRFELSRDQRALDEMLRSARYDRRDLNNDRYSNGYRR